MSKATMTVCYATADPVLRADVDRFHDSLLTATHRAGVRVHSSTIRHPDRGLTTLLFLASYEAPVTALGLQNAWVVLCRAYDLHPARPGLWFGPTLPPEQEYPRAA